MEGNELQTRIDALLQSGDKLTFCEFLQQLLADCKEVTPDKPLQTFKVVSEMIDDGSPLVWCEKPIDIIVRRRGVRKTVRYEVYVDAESAKDAIETGSTLITTKRTTENGVKLNALFNDD